MVRDLLEAVRLTPARIAGIYLLVGLLGVIVTDFLLPGLLSGPLLADVQAAKGFVEVFLTAGLLFVLVRWGLQDLRLRQRAIDAAPIGVTVFDPSAEANPVRVANEEFESMTGYDGTDIQGQPCDTLVGPETDDAAGERIQTAFEAEEPASVDLVNYRKDGAKFWNKIDLAPIAPADADETAFVAFHTDITERKVREERLRVLNRVLRHNVRNKMTVIGGHAEMLGREFDDPPASLSTLQSSVDEMQSLTETVRKSEAVLDAALESAGPIALDEQLRLLVHGFQNRYPEATIDLDVPEADVRVPDAGVVRAIEEAVDNAIRHNDVPDPTAEIRVRREGDGWLTIEVADDGPGIPPSQVEVLDDGETPLKHGNRLGIWSIHWIVTLAGGSLTVADADLGGTLLSLSVPGADARDGTHTSE